MTRNSNTALVASLALVAIGVVVAGTVVARPRTTAWWTNGGEIRERRESAPLRHVLWQPAAPTGAPGPGVDEYEPRVSADGSMMVFVRRRAGTNADLFLAHRTPTGWSEPEPLADINTEHDELGPELSPDGSRIFFYSDRPGGMGGFDVWVARRTEAGWGTATNLGPSVNSRWNEYGPAISPDAGTLYFSSNRPRPDEPRVADDAWAATLRERRRRHDYDLFRADVSGAEASPAVAISELNTPADEGAPAISPIGDFLYFASDRAGGLGGFDVYRSRLGRALAGTPSADGGTPAGSAAPMASIAAPENLGPSVNSAFNDLDPGLSTDGFRLYFSSDRPDQTGGPSDTDVAASGVEPAAAEGSSSDAMASGGEDGPSRYRLWSSGTREVYEVFEVGPRRAGLGDLWNALWPWLLLLLLGAAPLLVLARFLASREWRRRLGRLSLLMQCVLVSLLVHGLIASTLAVWKVGSGVIGALRHSGGTRVVLASSGLGADVSGQLFGGIAPDAPPAIEMSAIASELPAAQVRAPESAEVSPRSTPLAAPVLLSVRAERTELAPASPLVRSGAPTESGGVPTDLPEPAARTATLEAPGPTPAMPLPAAEAPVESVRPRSESAQVSPARGASQGGSDVVLATNLAPLSSESLASGPVGAGDVPASNALASPAMPGIAERARVSERSASLELPVAPAASGRATAPVPVAVDALTRDVELAIGGAPGPRAEVLRLPGGEETAPSAASASEPVSSVVSLDAAPGLLAGALPQPAPAPARGGGGESQETPVIGAGLLSPAPVEVGRAIAAADAGTAGPRMPIADGAPGDQKLALTDAPSSRPESGPSQVTGGKVTAAETAPAVASMAAGAALPTAGTRAERGTDSPGREDGSGGPEQDPVLGTLRALRAGTDAPLAPGAGDPETVMVEPRNPRAGSATRLSLSPGAPAAVGSAPRNTGVPSPAPEMVAAGSGLRLPDVLPEPMGEVKPVETFAQRAPEVRGEVLEQMGGSAKTERAVGLALEWFARHQESDGRWTGRDFDKGCGACGSPAEFDADAAMTGMALLCYLGAGHTHQSDGPYRERVESAIRWLVDRQDSSGDLRRGETMYGQTVATVALCEALAMTGDQRLAQPARRAVRFVLQTAASQNARRRPEDTSVLGWLVMTIESARRAGIEIPRSTLDAADRWLDSVGSVRSPGRYSYRPGEAPSAAMTAEAMFVRQLLGHARTEARMQESAEFILRTPPRWGGNAPTYHWYYATLALFEHQGPAWKQWNEAMVPALVDHQRQQGAAAGSWDPQDEWSRMGGRIYQTAVCTLSLEVYYRYKPR